MAQDCKPLLLCGMKGSGCVVCSSLSESRERMHSICGSRSVVMSALVTFFCILSVGGLIAFLSSPKRQLHATKCNQSSSQFFYVPVEDSMDLTVDPCEDFYSFVCGKWKDHVTPAEDGEERNTFSVLQDEVNKHVERNFKDMAALGTATKLPIIVNRAIEFYQSCVKATENEAQYSATVIEYLAKIGGWPLLGGDWDEENFNWLLMSSLIQKNSGLQTIIGVYVTEDSLNSTRNVLMIKAPDPKSESDSLVNSFSRLMLYCIVNSFNSSLTTDEIISDMSDMTKLEEKLQGLQQLGGRDNDSLRMSISELMLAIPGIDWMGSFHLITDNNVCSVSCISKTDDVLVRDIPYLRAIAKLFGNETSKRATANLLGWYAIQDLSLILSHAVRKYGKYYNFSEDERLSLTKRECFKKVQDTFGIGLDYIYLISTGQPDLQKSSEMVLYLKNAFKAMVMSSSWLDSKTKYRIILKLKAMHEVVGFINSSKSILDQMFSNFPQMTDDVIRNYLESRYYYVEKRISTLKMMNNFNNWVLPRCIRDVGAYYDAQRNAIVFPVSLHNPPFFYQSGPEYMNFGAIGSVIGHEITHGFDNRGAKRDQYGNLQDWWTKQSAREYNKRLACYEKQFNRYLIPGSNITVDGKKTLGENIADTVGLKQAYLAYTSWQRFHGVEPPYSKLKGFSPKQMFFISFASVWCADSQPSVETVSGSPHSPRKWRVIGSLSNLEYFSEAFGCDLGSPMNPREKCSLW